MSTETSEWSVCQLFKNGSEMFLSLYFVTNILYYAWCIFYWNKRYTVKAEFRLLSTLIQQRPSAHIEHPEEGILYASASSLWEYGAAQKYLKNQWQSQEQNCGPEEPASTHFATSCPPPSGDFLVNTPTLTAATVNWKRLYLQLLLSATHFSFYRGLPKSASWIAHKDAP